MSTTGSAVAEELDFPEPVVGASVTCSEGLVVGFAVISILLGDAEGVIDGTQVGLSVSVGDIVGCDVVGVSDGLDEGTLEGAREGTLVGTSEGTFVGAFVSPITVGRAVAGLLVGL